MKKIRLLSTLSVLGLSAVSILPIVSCNNPSVIHTITFSCSEGVKITSGGEPLSVKSGMKWKDVKKPHISVESTYQEYGWYNGLEPIDDEYVINQDFEARYIAIQKDLNISYITVLIDGQEPYTDLPILNTATWAEFKQLYNFTKEPTKDKHVLQGWFSGETKIEDNTVLNKSMTIETRFVLDFVNDTWENVTKVAANGLAYAKAYYVVSSFVGLQRTIQLDGKTFKVKVIDEEHDTITGTANKATLTFQTFNLLGTSLMDDETTENKNYLNSILRANLTGQGSPSKKTWSKTALDMLMESEPILYQAIKLVDKETSVFDGSSYVKKTYSDKLFVLTANESNLKHNDINYEGTPYKYWVTHPSAQDRNLGADYWLFTPANLTDSKKQYISMYYNIHAQRAFEGIAYQTKASVSFGFCI